MEPISVTALNNYIKSLLDNNEILSDLTLIAELDSFHLHRKSGHCYFTLKDQDSSVKAVMFSRDAGRLAFVPENGMQLMVRAKASIYQKDGTFQLYVSHMFLDGEGALNAAFLQMKLRLEKRGFFSVEHKKQLPQNPTCIGLVTSKDGAALQDILAVAKRRSLINLKFILYDVPVQGAAAALPIAKAIQTLDKVDDIDIILVSRGGGSAQDLFVFNSEKVAEAIFNADKPIVCAIGHEIDTVISDLVADVRAATPTAAAEIILPDPSQLLYRYQKAKLNINVNNIAAEVIRNKEMIVKLAEEYNHAILQRLEKGRRNVAVCSDILAAYEPKRVLKKGYAIIRTENKKLIVNTPKKGDVLEVETAKALIDCIVKSVKIKEK